MFLNRCCGCWSVVRDGGHVCATGDEEREGRVLTDPQTLLEAGLEGNM